MYELPTTILINGRPYGITRKGDYRMVIDCFTALNDVEISERERLYSALMIFYEDLDAIEDIFNEFGEEEYLAEAVHKMYWFFDCGRESTGTQTPYKLIDWEQDEQLISSAVNSVAHTEVRSEPYIHWWTFMGYYISVGESVLSSVVSIRNKIMRGKKLEDYEKEFKHDNPHYFKWNHKTLEEQEADKEFEAILEQWNKE